ncbi:MAG: hypothetical protein PVJ19_10310 [Desulfobacteraceae bacterium]
MQFILIADRNYEIKAAQVKRSFPAKGKTAVLSTANARPWG